MGVDRFVHVTTANQGVAKGCMFGVNRLVQDTMAGLVVTSCVDRLVQVTTAKQWVLINQDIDESVKTNPNNTL